MLNAIGELSERAKPLAESALWTRLPVLALPLRM